MITLRPYQDESGSLVRRSFLAGNKRVILCSPTGSGKTVIFSDIASKTVSAGNRSLILTDRIELLSQAGGALDAAGLSPEFIRAGVKADRINFRSSAFVGMVETLSRRLSGKHGPAFRRALGRIDLLIVDEAHKGNFRKILDLFPDTWTIGATATPISSSKAHPLKDYYSDIVENTSIPELINDGYLSPCRTYGAAEKLNTKDLKRKGGEYTEASQFDWFDKREHYADAVDKYLHFLPGKKALVFNINVEHSLRTLAAFRDAGIRSEHVDGTTPEHERRRIFEDFKNGVIQVLNNVGIATTGYDEPSIDGIILNRATASLPLYLQMIGRGSRIFKGKEHFTALDMGSNFLTFGTWDEPRSMSEVFHNPTKPKSKLDVAPAKECKNCGAVNHLSRRSCIICGEEFPKPKPNVEEIVGAHFQIVEPAEILKMDPKKWTFEDVLAVQELKGYKKGWLYYALAERGEPFLRKYAELQGYKKGWVWQTLKRFNKLPPRL